MIKPTEPLKLRRVVSVRGPRRRKKLWAYGYEDLSILLGRSEQALRQIARTSDLGDLRVVCDLYRAREFSDAAIGKVLGMPAKSVRYWKKQGVPLETFGDVVAFARRIGEPNCRAGHWYPETEGPCVCGERIRTGRRTRRNPAAAFSADLAPPSRRLPPTSPAGSPWLEPVFCEHANEVPGRCRCPENCPCRHWMCGPNP